MRGVCERGARGVREGVKRVLTGCEGGDDISSRLLCV